MLRGRNPSPSLRKDSASRCLGRSLDSPAAILCALGAAARSTPPGSRDCAQILGRKEVEEMKDVFYCGDILNMTFLALNLSHYVNGVAKKHGEITRLMFAGYNIDAITNGVHAASWAAKPFAELYDRYIPGWRQDNYSLRYAMSIPKQEI
jgi:glucan phosphorylase